MHIISKKKLKEFYTANAASKAALEQWWAIVDKGEYTSFAELRKTFPKADDVSVNDKTLTVFNIGGNNWRLVASIHYNTQKVYVRHIMTHAEYDKEKWKS